MKLFYPRLQIQMGEGESTIVGENHKPENQMEPLADESILSQLKPCTLQ